MRWNSEEAARLLDLYNNRNLSTDGCAKALPGRSRNSVQSKLALLRREGHYVRDADTPCRGWHFRKLIAPGSHRRPPVRPPGQAAVQAACGAAPFVASSGPPSFDPVNITDISELGFRHCRYVIGDPQDGIGNFAWCGRRTVRSGVSWCPTHYDEVTAGAPSRNRPPQEGVRHG